MRVILIFCLLVCSYWTFAQTKSQLWINGDTIYFRTGKRSHQFEEGDTLYTRSGYKFYCHQILKIGAGSGERGYFRYISLVNVNNTDMSNVGAMWQSVDKFFLQGSEGTQGSKSFITYHSNNPRVDFTQTMTPSNSGREFVITNLKASGSKKVGYTFLPVIAEPIGNSDKLKLGQERYYIDYENAVNSGELIYAGKQTVGKNPTSVEVKVVQEGSKSISIPDELAKLKKLYDSGALSKEEYDVAKKKLLDKL